MVARPEPGRDGMARPVVAETLMRAVGNDGRVAASLITQSRFACTSYQPR